MKSNLGNEVYGFFRIFWIFSVGIYLTLFLQEETSAAQLVYLLQLILLVMQAFGLLTMSKRHGNIMYYERRYLSSCVLILLCNLLMLADLINEFSAEPGPVNVIKVSIVICTITLAQILWSVLLLKKVKSTS